MRAADYFMLLSQRLANACATTLLRTGLAASRLREPLTILCLASARVGARKVDSAAEMLGGIQEAFERAQGQNQA